MNIIPNVLKEKLHNDEAMMNIRIHFPNGERTDICNDMIVNGSAKLTENLCSQNELKFGLCESPVFECETVEVGNIKGAAFDLTYEIICESSVAGSVWKNDIQKHVFEIPMGKFVVQSCERQADLQHRIIVGYGGGAATDWHMPQLELYKSLRMNSTHNYNCDISKVIQAKFQFGAKGDRISVNTDPMTLFRTFVENNGIEYSIDFWYTPAIVSEVNEVIITEIDYKHSQDETYEIIKNKVLELWGQDIYDLFAGMKFDWVYKQMQHNLMVNLYGTNMSVYVEPGKRVYPYHNSYKILMYIPYTIELTRKLPGSKPTDYAIGGLTNNVAIYRCENVFNPTLFTVNENNARDFWNYDLQKNLIGNTELIGKIAKFSRNGELEFIDIKKQFYLMPDDDLQPSEDLKPLGVNGGSILKSMYSNCWYGESYTKPFGAVYCQYNNTSNAKKEMTVYCEGYNSDTDIAIYQIYDISNNEIIKNNTYTSTQIRAILQTIANAISGVTYIPVQVKTVALPYVECGDTFEVLTESNDSINTIVLKRVLSGESYVTDEFISK